MEPATRARLDAASLRARVDELAAVHDEFAAPARAALRALEARTALCEDSVATVGSAFVAALGPLLSRIRTLEAASAAHARDLAVVAGRTEEMMVRPRPAPRPAAPRRPPPRRGLGAPRLPPSRPDPAVEEATIADLVAQLLGEGPQNAAV
eukprot:tig00000492_g1511.t1